MAKTVRLGDKLAEDLRSVAAGLCRLAETMEGQSAAPEQAAGAPAEAKAEKALALEDVRAVLAEKSRDGYTAEVRGLLQKHGADKLSEIDPEHYADLLADAEVLGNG